MTDCWELPLVRRNLREDLWLTDGENSYFIPAGWADSFNVEWGCTGGPDFVDEGVPTPELYGYAPTHNQPNSPVATMFVEVALLEGLREVSEEEAKRIHPRLADYLDAINRGEDPDA